MYKNQKINIFNTIVVQKYLHNILITISYNMYFDI